MKKLIFLAPLVLLAACVEDQPVAPVPPPKAETCAAEKFSGLVGQSRGVLDKMTLPPGTRVIGPRDPVTMDFRPDRMNFEIGETGRITKIGCY